jgi:hypothetical protein
MNNLINKYANGGSVEYNPITVDQIIDATHQELGTGRYAKGGSVNKMQAIPQNESLAALAYALSKARDIGDKVQLPYDLGGVGEFFIGKTPEELENWSYGNAPMQVPEMSNLPQFKKGRGESFGDAVTTLLPIAKGTKDFPVKMSIKRVRENLNADLLEKYLVTGKLSPDDMALYEYNGRLMEAPNTQRFNLENARAQIPNDLDRMAATEFTTPSYHASREGEDIYEFDNRISDPSLFNGLGVHSGTKAAAIQRANDTAGVNRKTGEKNPDMATYYPLQLRANKSFEINGRPTDEYGSEIHLDSLGRPLGMGRETDTGRAAIQDAYFKNNDVLKYINDVEDKGSVSYISPPENIRSRFAAFDPLRKNSTSILANVLGGTALSDLALKYGDNEDVGYASGGAVVKGIKKLAKNLNEALLGKHLAGETLTPEEMIKYEKNATKMETPNLHRFNVENAMANPEREAYKAEVNVDFLHGTERLDRLLSKAGLDPKRATSGPMLFGTDAPPMSSNYAMGKKDTSIFDTDDWDYSKAYTVLPKDMGLRGTSPYTVEQSWYHLPPEVKKDILSKAPRVGYSNIDEGAGDLMLHPETQDAINKSHFDYLLKEHRNNPLAALRDYWVDSGNLYDEEQKLEDIYKAAGYPHPISQDTAPWASAKGVLLGRARITNPLVTSNISELQEKVIPALKDAFKNDRSRLKIGADQWDKNSRFTPKEWVNELESDTNKGENSFVFTSIPDKVTSALKDLGYNGIFDMGGKGGGASHQVTIPFEPSQIRSRFAAFDPLRKNSTSLVAGTALGDLLLKYEDKAQDNDDPAYAKGGSVKKESSAMDDYEQLLEGYPNASKFLSTLRDNVMEHIPETGDYLSPEKMLEYGLSMSPMGIGSIGSIPKKQVTVKDPERIAYPGIYDRPDEIARLASQNVAPEDEAMKRLFGVTRDDLYELRKSRPEGNEAPNLVMPANPKGAKVAPQIMTRKNTQRIIDTLAEAEKYPELQKGMDAWYEMGPLFERYLQISDNPIEDFNRFQAFTGMASPGSDVLTEINRGTAALTMDNQGRFEDFLRHGGKAFNTRGSGFFPEDLEGVMGHPYHSTAHGKPMSKYIESGRVDMSSPKVPLYIQSAGVPETGFQTALPVGDAHFSRMIGLADVRTNKDYGASISTPELLSLGDWWKNKIAKELGINSVNAQGRGWGTFAPATGVTTAVGAPKLELISQKIMDAAHAYGITPEEARDAILTGKMYAPNLSVLEASRKRKEGYADGGSVEYNPIKIDQIIDATHKELGTGRYADGGSVNTTLKLG